MCHYLLATFFYCVNNYVVGKLGKKEKRTGAIRTSESTLTIWTFVGCTNWSTERGLRVDLAFAARVVGE